MTNHSHPDSDRWRELAPADPGSDPTRDFWGDADDWPSEPTDELAVGAPRTGLGATIGRWWNSSARPATRTHASSPHTRPETPQRPDPTTAVEVSDPQHVSDDANAEDWDDGWEPALRPRPGVDPLLARLGGAAIVVTLLVPVVMGFTSGTDDADTVRTAATASAATPALDDATDTAVVPSATPSPSPSRSAATAAAADETPASAGTESADPTPTAEPSIEATDQPATEALVVSPCGDSYEIAPGDFWIRIADGAGVEISDLLAVNDATSDTPLYPGRTICLPVGADTPPPPPTTPSTSAPTASTNKSSSGSTNRGTSPTPTATAPRTTTAPPTTATPPAPPAAWSTSAVQVQSIIRDVWPDELEDRALEIAWRESNYRPTAKNNCCYGVFQIYWSVHRSWLADLGITSAEQLFDPTLNARAALTLYQRAGGWGPWGG